MKRPIPPPPSSRHVPPSGTNGNSTGTLPHTQPPATELEVQDETETTEAIAPEAPSHHIPKFTGPGSLPRLTNQIQALRDIVFRNPLSPAEQVEVLEEWIIAVKEAEKKPQSHTRSDPTGMIVAAIIALLFFCSTGVFGFLYWKKPRTVTKIIEKPVPVATKVEAKPTAEGTVQAVVTVDPGQLGATVRQALLDPEFRKDVATQLSALLVAPEAKAPDITPLVAQVEQKLDALANNIVAEVKKEMPTPEVIAANVKVKEPQAPDPQAIAAAVKVPPAPPLDIDAIVKAIASKLPSAEEIASKVQVKDPQNPDPRTIAAALKASLPTSAEIVGPIITELKRSLPEAKAPDNDKISSMVITSLSGIVERKLGEYLAKRGEEAKPRPEDIENAKTVQWLEGGIPLTDDSGNKWLVRLHNAKGGTKVTIERK